MRSHHLLLLVVALPLAAAGCDDTRPPTSYDAGGIQLTVDSGPGIGVDAGRPPEPGTEGALRLVDGASANEGRLEVFHNGQWGTVCDDSFSAETDGFVACRQLGFAGADAVTDPTPGVDPIWMDDVECTGSELRLVDCPFSGWGVENCSHSEDVGLICF